MNKLKQHAQEIKAKIAADNNPNLQKILDYLQKKYEHLRKDAKIVVLATLGLGSMACSNSSENRKESDHSQDFTPEYMHEIESNYEKGTRISYDEAVAMLDAKVKKGEIETDTLEMYYGDTHPAQVIFYGNHDGDKYISCDNKVAEKIIFHDGTRDLTLKGNAQEVSYVSWKDGKHTETMTGNLNIEDYYLRRSSNLTILDRANCSDPDHEANIRGCRNGRVVIGENGESIKQVYNDAGIPYLLNKAKGNNMSTSVDTDLFPGLFPYTESTCEGDIDLTYVRGAKETERTAYEADGTKVVTDRFDKDGKLESRTRFLSDSEYTASFTYDKDVISTVTWSQEGKEDVSLDVRDLGHHSSIAGQYAHLTPQEAAKCNKGNIETAVAQSYINSGEQMIPDSPFYKKFQELSRTNIGYSKDIQRD